MNYAMLLARSRRAALAEGGGGGGGVEPPAEELFNFTDPTPSFSGAFTSSTYNANGPSHGRGGFAFAGGVLTPSGKVVLVPYDSTVVGIYDPVADTYANGPSHGGGGFAFYGGVLTPSGKVVLVPFNSSTVGILSPDPLLSVSSSTAMSPYLNKF